MLSHSTTQIPFFCNNLYTNRFGFSIQMQRLYFHKKWAKNNKDILQILDIVENYCIRKCHVTVNVRQYYHINRSEKPVTRTRENPHPATAYQDSPICWFSPKWQDNTELLCCHNIMYGYPQRRWSRWPLWTLHGKVLPCINFPVLLMSGTFLL